MQGGESETKPLKRLHGFFWASSSLTRPTPITFTIHFANPFTPLSHLLLIFSTEKQDWWKGHVLSFVSSQQDKFTRTYSWHVLQSAVHHPIIATSTVWSKFSTSLRCIITRVGDKTTAFSKLLTYIDQNVMNLHTAPTSVLHSKDTKLAMTQKPSKNSFDLGKWKNYDKKHLCRAECLDHALTFACL